MVRALDEPDAVYGLLAESVTLSDDRNTFIFALRPPRASTTAPRLRPTTSPSASTYKEKGHPDLLLPLAHVVEAVAVDPATLRLSFYGKQSARTILNIVDFPIVSKAFF